MLRRCLSMTAALLGYDVNMCITISKFDWIFRFAQYGGARHRHSERSEGSMSPLARAALDASALPQHDGGTVGGVI